METVNGALLEIGVASLPRPGESVSGDRHLVEYFPGGALLAVVDGLGHGSEAAEAADVAVTTLARHPHESVISLVRQCHAELHRTRGVVMSLASISSRYDAVSWLCVGNVESVVVKADASAHRRYEAPVLRGGVVGEKLPPLIAAVKQVSRGDTLILVTDGIRSGFAYGLPRLARPQLIADLILTRYGKGTDDALVLVARYLGDSR